MFKWDKIVFLLCIVFLVAIFLHLHKSDDREDYNQGIAAYKDGHYETAYNKFRPLAEKGHAGSQNYLGIMYNNGNYVRQDFAAAYMMYKLAEANGDTKHAPNNRKKLFKNMTQNQIARAYNYLGVKYQEGKSVNRNYVLAIAYYYFARKKGETQYAYENYQQLWGKMTAIERANALNFIGKQYEDGTGITQNLETAVDYYNKALKINNSENARRNLERVTSKIDQNERAEAIRRENERKNAQAYIDAYEQGDLTALNKLQQLAKKGNPHAQSYLDSIVQCIDPLGKYKYGVTSVAFSPDGKYLASGCKAGTLRLWKIDGAKMSRETLLSENSYHTVTSLVFSPNGKILASSQDNTIKIWDVLYKTFWRQLPRQSHAVTSVAFWVSDKYLAFGSGKQIKMWDASKSNVQLLPLGEHAHYYNNVTSVAFSPNGRILASGSQDNTIKIWSTGLPSYEFGSFISSLKGHTDDVTSVAFSPNGRILASGSQDNTIKIWDVDLSTEDRFSQKTSLKGHTGSVTSVAFSPDGRILASGSQDNTIKIWDVDSDSENEIISLKGHTGAVTSVAFSPDRDSKILASGSADHTIKLWKVSFLSQPTLSPKLSIKIASLDYGKVLNAEETVELTIRIKNDGTADANNLEVKLSSNLQGLSFPESTSVVPPISKGGGEGTVPITIHGKPDLRTVQQAPVNISVIDPKFGQQQDTTIYFETLASNDIDVRKDIPNTNMDNPHAVAVVIGNRNYTAPLPNVDYAHNDALFVKKYLIQTLGYKEDNIIYHKDAKTVTFLDIFGTEKNPKGTLFNQVSPDGLSDIFIFYSGHGVPDVKSESVEKPPYLLPVGVTPASVSLSGYSLDLLYRNLNQIPHRHATVVIDACFNGTSAGGRLFKSSGFVFPKMKISKISYDKSAIFTAVKPEQLAYWDDDNQHGLFTYFFLKALRGEADGNRDGQLTASEIDVYVKEHVSDTARRDNEKGEQNPEFIGNREVVLVKYKR